MSDIQRVRDTVHHLEQARIAISKAMAEFVGQGYSSDGVELSHLRSSYYNLTQVEEAYGEDNAFAIKPAT